MRISGLKADRAALRRTQGEEQAAAAQASIEAQTVAYQSMRTRIGLAAGVRS